MSITEKELRKHFESRYLDFTKRLNGNQLPEITEIRNEAIKKFSQQGFPLNRDEEYKYTPITRSLLKSIKIGAEQTVEAAMVPPVGEHLLPDLKGFILVFWNGKLVYRSDDLPAEIELTQLGELNTAQQNNFIKYLATLSNLQSDAFASLNTAFINQGSIIRVKEGAVVDQPIIIYHLSDGSLGTIYTQTRHLVIAEKNSQATLVEINKNTSPNLQVFQNAVSEIFLDQEARLNLYKLQTNCDKTILVDNTSINQQQQSFVSCSTITTGGSMIRNNLNITINGEHCESHMYGLYLVQGKDHVDNHTTVDHRVANSFSNELYKGIIDDSATGVFNGKIFVQQDAQKTNAFQSNKNILLSDKASMNTKPQLEIWADDVKCSHGATTGQLDKDQVFYLRARGLDEKQARGLLLYAFATELLENISIPVLKEHLEKIISTRLYQEQS
jgi:Fe-S cluster assembly protein SufD